SKRAGGAPVPRSSAPHMRKPPRLRFYPGTPMSTSSTVERIRTTGVSAGTPAVAPANGRLRALDGMRGIAAMIVVIYHLSLVARPYLETGTVGDAWWWLTRTPLKLFTAGTEA